MDQLRELQINLEMHSIQQGVERYQKDRQAAAAAGRAYDGGPEAAALNKFMDSAVPAIRAVMLDAKQRFKSGYVGGRRVAGCVAHLQVLSPQVLAYITVRALLSAASASAKRNTAARIIANHCETQLRFDEAKKKERARVKEEGGRSRVVLLQKRIKKHSKPENWRKWLSRLEEATQYDWTYSAKLQVGTALLNAVVEALPGVFEFKSTRTTKNSKTTEIVTIHLTDTFLKDIQSKHEHRALLKPWLVAMITPPRPWEWCEEAGKYVGGYLALPADVVRTTLNKHTAAHLKNGYINDEIAKSISAIQETPWRINTTVLAWAHQALDLQLDAILPVAGEKEMPASVDKEQWKKLPKDERSAIKYQRQLVHMHNAKTRDRRIAMFRKLNEADDKAQYERIYFPHSLDFRSRIYPLPQDLNPQSDDLGKALLTFADAVPLGPEGLKYLSYHVANVYGQDKGSRQEQLTWIQDNIQSMITCVNDPFGSGYEFLCGADKPWQFLAASVDLVSAMTSDNPEEFMSSIPVAIDGSNNGLQHLAAMSRDPIGAKATNLCGSASSRQDIYREVLARVDEQVAEDAEKGIAAAVAWNGKTCRTTCKRAVMTRPYGLTRAGAYDQLKSDKGVCTVGEGYIVSLEGDATANASYMRDKIWKGMETTIGGADAVMDWLQSVSDKMAEQELSVSWITPAGFKVVQGYFKHTARKIATVAGIGRSQCGRVTVYESRGVLDKKEQRNGISPNVVHSFDAAHLLLTVAACKEAGLTSFAVVHDSYGTHAGNASTLVDCTRRTFHEIYSNDWLQTLYENFVNSGAQDIPPPPAKGDYDIKEVLNSEFFFA